MRITVFTPTYNRAYCLKRLYESLKAQTFHDFEWVIVDDGSTDNTEEVVNGFISDKPFFEIKYCKTENGGKHRAINRGMDTVAGELFFIMDSDDWLREDALEWLDKVENSIPTEEKTHFCGVNGLRCHTDGSIIGHTFDGNGFKDGTYFERDKYGIRGDKAEAYYTDVMKKYPFPEFDGEKFMTEGIVWNEFAHAGLKIRYFNEEIYFCEYLEDGLTHGGWNLYACNPRQWGSWLSQNYKYGKHNTYYSMLHIYEFYLYEKKNYSLREIAGFLQLPVGFLVCSICVHSAMDLLRFVLHRGNTVRRSVKKEKHEG